MRKLLLFLLAATVALGDEPIMLDTKSHKVVSPATIDFSTAIVLGLPGGGPITLSGDVTGTGTSSILTHLVNIPDLTTAAGRIQWTQTSGTGVGTPPTFNVYTWFDTTDQRLHDRNSVGSTATTVAPSTGTSGQFVNGLNSAGVLSYGTPGGAGVQYKFNVKAPPYNAAGDGVTNDTTAIQSALAAIPSTGGVLYFPAGEYVYNGATLTIPNLVTVEGDGGGTEAVSLTDSPALAVSTIDFNSATVPLFTVTGNGCTFKNIELRNTSSSAPTAGAGIVVTSGGDRTNYQNISVNGFYVDIDVQSGWMQNFDNCYIIAPVLYGLKLRNVANPDYGDHSISNCQFLTAKSRAATSAIRIESGGGVKIVNTKINMMAVLAFPWVNGIDLAVASGVTTSDLLVSNCSIESFSGAGIKGTTGATSSLWSNIVITGNQFSAVPSGSQYAIYLSSTTFADLYEITITGNVAGGASPNPMISVTNCKDLVMTGNLQYGFSGMFGGSGNTFGTAATLPLGGTTGQVLKKNTNTDYDVAWGAGGGTGTPGGSNTQVQFNDSGAFGGNASLVWDKTNDILTVAPTVAGSAPYYSALVLKGNTSGVDAATAFESGRNATIQDWYVGSGNGGATPNNNFRMVDLTSGATDVLNIQTGSLHQIALYGIMGWTNVGNASGTIDTAFTRNSAGMVEVNNGVAGTYRDLKARNFTMTGATITEPDVLNLVGSGAANHYVQLKNTNGTSRHSEIVFQGASTTEWQIGNDGLDNGTSDFFIYNSSTTLPRFYLNGNAVSIPTTAILGWGTATVGNFPITGVDTALARNAAGILEVNNGTAGTFRDLKLRNLTVTGTCTGCGGGGGGTIASTSDILKGDGAGNAVALGASTPGYNLRNNGTNFAAYPMQITNASTADQTGFAADQYLTGSSCVVAAGDMKAKGAYHCVFDMSKTAASTATIIITVRIGTAGTTADTSQITFTYAAGTAVAESGTFDVYVVWRSVGSGTAAVVSGLCRATHNNAAGGLYSGNAGTIVGTTSAGFDSSAVTTIGVSFNGGAAFVGTNKLVQASLQQ